MACTWVPAGCVHAPRLRPCVLALPGDAQQPSQRFRTQRIQATGTPQAQHAAIHRQCVLHQQLQLLNARAIDGGVCEQLAAAPDRIYPTVCMPSMLPAASECAKGEGIDPGEDSCMACTADKYSPGGFWVQCAACASGQVPNADRSGCEASGAECKDEFPAGKACVFMHL